MGALLMSDDKVAQLALRYYDSSLPYHNYGHIQDCLAAADAILARCRKKSVKVDERIVRWALLFHDAGYHEDHRAKGFDDKEEYSAQIAGRCLGENGATAQQVGLVQQAIRATRRGSEVPLTAEVQAVRAADLSQLATEYAVFKSNTVKLQKEHKKLSGSSVPWTEWVARVVPEVEGFVEAEAFREPALTDKEAGEMARRIRANLDKLKKDPRP